MLLSLLNSARLRPELLILVLMVMIISMFVIPLPTYLVDFLIALNIVLAILVFMGSFYIDRILSFSTFPAVLLITTLFRLALSISTSRLILIEADAGEIIATFGQFVIGDSFGGGFCCLLYCHRGPVYRYYQRFRTRRGSRGPIFSGWYAR